MANERRGHTLLSNADVLLADVKAKAAALELRGRDGGRTGSYERVQDEIAFVAGQRDASTCKGEREFSPVSVLSR